MNVVWQEVKKKLFNKRFLIVVSLVLLFTLIGISFLEDIWIILLQLSPIIVTLIIEALKIKFFNKTSLKNYIKENSLLIYMLVNMLIINIMTSYENSKYIYIISPILFIASFYLFVNIDKDDDEDDKEENI